MNVFVQLFARAIGLAIPSMMHWCAGLKNTIVWMLKWKCHQLSLQLHCMTRSGR